MVHMYWLFATSLALLQICYAYRLYSSQQQRGTKVNLTYYGGQASAAVPVASIVASAQSMKTDHSEKHSWRLLSRFRLFSTKDSTPTARKQPLRVIIAGAPACGKGTQCEYIKAQFGLVHLSTGDILRAAVKEGTQLGLKAKAFMDGGKLVPDALIIDVVCDRLKQADCQSQGWLLDGFPRTRAQAEALEKLGMSADAFILLDVPEEALVMRVIGRRTDPVTGKIYHLTTKPPETAEIAARLVQRSDDTDEKIKIRYRDFKANIDAVRACYEDRLVVIDGTKNPAQVSSDIHKSLYLSLSLL